MDCRCNYRYNLEVMFPITNILDESNFLSQCMSTSIELYRLQYVPEIASNMGLPQHWSFHEYYTDGMLNLLQRNILLIKSHL